MQSTYAGTQSHLLQGKSHELNVTSQLIDVWSMLDGLFKVLYYDIDVVLFTFLACFRILCKWTMCINLRGIKESRMGDDVTYCAGRSGVFLLWGLLR